MPPSNIRPNNGEKQEELPGDNGSTPFSLPDDVAASQSSMQTSTAPATDDKIDSQEAYDEGLADAAEMNQPDPGSVEGYNPKSKNNTKKPFKLG